MNNVLSKVSSLLITLVINLSLLTYSKAAFTLTHRGTIHSHSANTFLIHHPSQIVERNSAAVQASNKDRVSLVLSSSSSSSSDNKNNDNDNDNNIVSTKMNDSKVDITNLLELKSMEDMEFLLSHKNDNNNNNNNNNNNDKSPLMLSTAEQVQDYLEREKIETILFDCDGVLYRGTDVIPNAANAIQSLMNHQKVLFVTNNAGSSRIQLCQKLSNLFSLNSLLTKEQMISSSYTAASYLSQKLLPSSSPPRIHVIGSEGLCQEISSVGQFHVTTVDNDESSASMSRDELADYDFDEHDDSNKVDAVVVGLDTEFTYRKLCIANVLLQRNPNAILVATNRDAYDLVGADARHLPGNGALVAALECASCRTAIDVGKPSATLAQIIIQDYGIDPSRTLMVGDRLDTDITFGNINGMKTALVLTGCTTPSQILDFEKNKANNDNVIPSIIIPHMGLMG